MLRTTRLLAAQIGLFTLALAVSHAQPETDLSTVLKALDRDGKVTLARLGVEVKTFDFRHDDKNVEAIAFRPLAEGKHPGILLIPGYSRTARDYLPLGVRLAREGFACVAVTQTGFGKSEGTADFVGPRTLAPLTAAYERFAKEPYVDAGRMGLFGYSRGAMAASLLAVRLPGVKAAVFGAGVYDFKRAYDEVKLEGIRANMAMEAGLTEQAVRERSSLFQMDKLACPVLILHGEKDENAPVSQAAALKDRLTQLGKEFEIHLFPDKDHDIGRQELNRFTVDFFKRKLAEKK